ncbi:tRNA (adenosine(37)-N6)-dimethylallyltransferase MiaA [Sphingomonas aliaeris]|uniref:tRNA dimethylallyltransferase n=1 Tax=Sphingomonas aliaeris TaxID=2759526 RepID=A0A974NSI2_9SPHN|nr:tRNA (adenosine(37)-N6)-dimethylallyltransferase MiaA [Sphingomonas aliaeris]QQV76114.1 tRNA (adenosine(37)-N6)-dimethylallyltransferase MiaA [Sphingomonas aliaeris]
MNIVQSLPRVALIAGPTASGKSALAMDLAAAHDGVVVNADSAQVYANLRILSARPTVEDEARVPHRLFGYIDGAESCSAARWATDAQHVIAEVQVAGKLPILVGGTGLYLRTLLDGIAPVPDIDPAIRAEVRALPVAQAHARLQQADPEAAARLAPADTTRVARALEVALSTGRTLAQWQAHKEGGIADRIDLIPLILLPDRDWLLARCDARAEAMMQDGAVAEVEALLARPDITPNLSVRRAIGVAEIADWLAGRIAREQALDALRLATRQYAKRQYTWFRNQSPPGWPRIEATETSNYAASYDRLLQL